MNIQKSFHLLKDLPSVALFDFWEPLFYTKFQQQIKTLDFQQEKIILSHSFAEAKSFSPMQETFDKKDFLEFLSLILSKKIKNIAPQILSFQHRDYTILNDATEERAGIDLIFNLADNWNDDWGGYVVYATGDGDYIPITTKGNTLTIISRKKGINKFVKYVNHKAGKEKMYFVMITV